MQVSSIMRRGATGYWHWCPACEMHHPLPLSWNFNGNVEKPTFSPSFKQMRIRNGDCHYFITDGNIQFLSDSWHHRSDIVAMPALPEPVSDFGCETQD